MDSTALHHVVIIGGGPTGVELAGTLSELAYGTLKGHLEQAEGRRNGAVPPTILWHRFCPS